jgi:hypothetical protein
MARPIKLSLLFVIALALGFQLARYVDQTAYAQQATLANPRLEVQHAGVLDPPRSAVRAAFIKDIKTGDCWLWLEELGASPALAPAKEAACRQGE